MAGRIEVTAREIRVVDPRSLGDPALDAVLGDLAGVDEPVRPLSWFRRRRRAAELHLRTLAQAGVIRVDRPWQWLFLRRLVLLDPGRRAELCAQIDSVVQDGAPRDVRHRALIRLVCQSQLHRVLYPGWRGRSARSRLCGARASASAGLRDARNAAPAPHPADIVADPVLLASIDAVLDAAAKAMPPVQTY